MKHILATTLTLVAALVALQPTKSKADFTIYPTSTVMATNTGTGCPGSYIAYAVYIKSAPTFGWNPDTNNFTLFTATSTGANTNVVVQFSGKSSIRVATPTRYHPEPTLQHCLPFCSLLQIRDGLNE